MTFEYPQSTCPACGLPIPAAYVRHGNAVYLEKSCPEHGPSCILASEDAVAFERWLASPSVTVPPRIVLTEGSAPCDLQRHTTQRATSTACPHHCGPCPDHLMTACCVLLNVTSRCNQRCSYCFANAGEEAPTDPPLADIALWLDRLIALGEERKFNLQLSGGEPTVRPDLPDIIRLCKDKGFEYVQLNTNGKLLAEDPAYAKTLKAAGLTTVFMQFDGVSDEVHIAMRGERMFETKKAAIMNCAVAGLPVTLVPTMLKSTADQIGPIIDFMLENISVVKGVHFQPAAFFGRHPDERNADGDYDERLTMFAVMDEIEKQTGGRISKADLAPITTGHPLCCFCAAFMKEADGTLRPLSSGGSCCDPALAPFAADPLEIIRRDRDFVLNKWDVHAPNEPPCCPPPELCVEHRRCEAEQGVFESEAAAELCEAVASLSAEPLRTRHKARFGTMSFDEAISSFKRSSFTISGMPFMDETNLDAERLRRCRVQVYSPDDRLIPFCAYYAKTGETP
ncbi:MAG: radical SAM protein [Clostridiales bacterium]|nr:radical SAM protein [Clostridiales bacterium]